MNPDNEKPQDIKSETDSVEIPDQKDVKVDSPVVETEKPSEAESTLGQEKTTSKKFTMPKFSMPDYRSSFQNFIFYSQIFTLLLIVLAILVSIFVLFNQIGISFDSGNNDSQEDMTSEETENDSDNTNEEEIIKQNETLKQSAVVFNNEIINRQRETILKITDFSSKLQNGQLNVLNIQSEYETLLTDVNSANSIIKNMSVVAEGEEFHNAAVELFDFYVNLIENQYPEWINLVSKKTRTQEESNRMNAIINTASKKEQELDTKLTQAQASFAAIYDITLSTTTTTP